MPRGDRTGPWGWGSRTGRGLGYCSGYSTPGYTKGLGMGMGWGRGWGHGWRRGGGAGWGGAGGGRFFPYPFYYPSEATPPYPASPIPLDPKEESKYLEQTLTRLKKEIELIEKRLEELASEKQV
ncbi:MAG: DUF5320 domain-containing protein [Candidatus Heimdallarchaeota archaeon]|nr:MAG: DUF5320 domain-containing protein [Candidatus Heimdallarchaeota archaeon]